jgi:RNA:NAD 2'-phosphotransferase (TPT1/KptA family)
MAQIHIQCIDTASSKINEKNSALFAAISAAIAFSEAGRYAFQRRYGAIRAIYGAMHAI